MNAQQTLLQTIRHSASPLVAPRPLAHSQELRDNLPLVRRHLGPRAWYQALESAPAASPPRTPA